MRKIISMLLIIAIIGLCGCSISTKSNGSSTDDVANIDSKFASFKLPDGYSMSQQTDTSVIIYRDSLEVGGMNVTALNPSCLLLEGDEITNYLEALYADTHTVQYLNVESEGIVYSILALTDIKTNDRHEQRHIFFEKDSTCYDFWYNLDIMTSSEGNTILDSLLPTA